MLLFSYGDTGVALLRPLAAGERPWPELLEAAAQIKQAQAAAAQQLAAVQQVCMLLALVACYLDAPACQDARANLVPLQCTPICPLEAKLIALMVCTNREVVPCPCAK